MSDRLTAKPGTPAFLRQLLEITRESDLPMDKALTKVLLEQLAEAREAEGSQVTEETRETRPSQREMEG